MVIMTTFNLNTQPAMTVKMYCHHHSYCSSTCSYCPKTWPPSIHTSALHIYLWRHTEDLVRQHKVEAAHALQTLKAT